MRQVRSWLARIAALALYGVGLALFATSVGAYGQSGYVSPKQATWVAMNLGVESLRESGHYSQAETDGLSALEFAEREFGPRSWATAGSLHTLGWLYYRMGRFGDSLSMHKRAVEVSEWSHGSSHLFTAKTLNGLAELYRFTGQYDKALPLFERSIKISERGYGIKNPVTAIALNNLALLYQDMGQYDNAHALLTRSLEIRKNQPGGNESANTSLALANIAFNYRKMGKPRESLPFITKALEISAKTEGLEHVSTGERSRALADTYRMLGEYGKALPLAIQSLVIAERTGGGEHFRTAYSLNVLGILHRAMNQPDAALASFIRAYTIAHSLELPQLAKQVQTNLAHLFYKQGKRDLAILFGKEAVNTVQDLRVNSRGFEREYRESLISSNRSIYSSLGQWLIESGRLPEAQIVLAMLKENELNEFNVRGGLRDKASVRVDFSGQEQLWHEHTGAAAGALGSLARQIDELERIAAAERTDLQKEQLRRLQDRVSELQQKFVTELGEIQREANASSQQASNLVRDAANRAQNNLRELLDRMGEQSGTRPGAIQYLVGEERLYLLVSLPGLQFARDVPVSASALRIQIDAFRRDLLDPRLDPRGNAKKLYELLIAPVVPELNEAKIEHLMLSLTDALRYVPFAALFDGQKYLVESFQLSMMTEAALGVGMTAPRKTWTIGALGVSEKVSDKYSALPAVAAEVSGIVRDSANPLGALTGHAHMNRAFTEETYGGVIATRPSVIHIATHFNFSPNSESQSNLLLGDGKELSLVDMMSERFRFRQLDLLTLSACETAIGGGVDRNGREVEAFGVTAQKNGAAAVIATLWQVSDESTGKLMQRFYSLRAQDAKLNKAEALRQAQLELLSGRTSRTSETAAGDTERFRAAVLQRTPGQSTSSVYVGDPRISYGHPYYWAPFVLMGNWL